MSIDSSDFRVTEGAAVHLKKWQTLQTGVHDHKANQEMLSAHVKALAHRGAAVFLGPLRRTADSSSDGLRAGKKMA